MHSSLKKKLPRKLQNFSKLHDALKRWCKSRDKQAARKARFEFLSISQDNKSLLATHKTLKTVCNDLMISKFGCAILNEHVKEMSFMNVAPINQTDINLCGTGTMICVPFIDGYPFKEGGDMFECEVTSVKIRKENGQDARKIISLSSCRDSFCFDLDNTGDALTCTMECAGLGYFKWNDKGISVNRAWCVSLSNCTLSDDDDDKGGIK